MTKQEKIESLKTAMTYSKRDTGNKEPEIFNHFTDSAPQELQNIFREHYNIRDLDFEIFNQAINMLSEIWNDTVQNNDGLELIEDQIYEQSSDSASVYTSDRLEYLNMWNEEDISETMRECGENSIATTCAIWYDKQVEQAAILINEWINK